jgi:putative cardiolipin synthase
LARPWRQASRAVADMRELRRELRFEPRRELGFAVIIAAFVAACTTLPGANYPREDSVALAQPEATRLGRQLMAPARKHAGSSGFRLLVQGTDSLRTRLDLAAAAERTLDLQYFLIQNDTTGKLLMDSVVSAADRGVRVRMLIDDADDVQRDRQLVALAAHPRIEIRIFNPFYTRGVLDMLRYAEFVVSGERLNHRMHNKLFVADNAAAVLGGRNVGDEYFQASTRTEFGDFDVLAVGPLVRQISESFDDYWNSPLSIPVQALLAGKPAPQALEQYRADLAENRAAVSTSSYIGQIGRAKTLSAIISDDGALTWATSELLYDSPDKKKVQDGEQDGQVLRHRLGQALRSVTSELLIVSPYLVPGDGGMRLLEGLRARGVKVRVLTNSLASTDMPIVHAGYRHYRERMLEDGIQLYEVRPLLGDPGGGGGSLKSPSSGQFALHAKVFVLDRERLFLGSMNFDRRSLRLNTEIGVLIDSPQLARQIVARFDAIAQPANCYVPTLRASDGIGGPSIAWRTEENGKPIETSVEPMGDPLRGIKAQILTLLPIDELL